MTNPFPPRSPRPGPAIDRRWAAAGTRPANRRPAWRPSLACLLGVLVLASGCSWFGGDDGAKPGGLPAPGPSGTDDGTGTPARQLRFRLSQGQSAAPATSPVVDGTALSDGEVAALLARLPKAADTSADDAVAFQRPPQSLRPPPVADTVAAPFPPAGGGSAGPAPTPGAADPLQVVRIEPQGDVGVAPYLAVTFNQPMVPLTTVSQVEQTGPGADVPVQLTPALPGRWRWIGTRTLRFELDPATSPGGIDRLPAATDYKVTVPAGTRSANGTTLAEAVTATFATPAPTVAAVTGLSDATGLTPMLVVRFDQRVDPAAVLGTTTLTAGKAPVALRAATPAEIEADDTAAAAVHGSLEGRWVALRPVDPLPAATPLTLAIGPRTPSAEGPRTSAEAKTVTGRTFDPLTVVEQACNYGGTCDPLTPWTIRFNNPLDTTAFDPATVTVAPAVPGLRVTASGDQLMLTGATRGRTKYTVTLPAEVADTFGQRLGRVTTRTFDVGPARPLLAGPRQQFVTTDPMAATPSLGVTTVNHDKLRVKAYQVTPADMAGFLDRGRPNWPPVANWKQVQDQTVEVKGQADAATETALDLTAAFAAAGGNQLVVRVEPTRAYKPDDPDAYSNQPVTVWVQHTHLGLDAHFDGRQLALWTSDLTTGAPRPDVAVDLLGDTGRPVTRVTTDAQGVARIDLAGPSVKALLAADQADTALLASDGYPGWQPVPPTPQGAWYLFDDRGIYKPGETVRVTGWVRRQELAGAAALGSWPGTLTVAWRAMDAQGADLASGTTPVNPLGGFNLSLALPAGANLGPAQIQVTLNGPGVPRDQVVTVHQLQIQDYRTPEFEVAARAESTGPYTTAAPATMAVDANYYAGGPLPDAEVAWTVASAETTYRPPNWDQFSFGRFQPWWTALAGGGRGGDTVGPASSGPRTFGIDPVGISSGKGGGIVGPGGGAEVKTQTFAGRTDGNGHHYLQVDFDGPSVDLPATVTAEAAVTDVNRQQWASRTNLLVHPAQVYVGLRADRPFVEAGTPIRVDTVVTGIDGAAAAGRPVTVTAGRLEWAQRNGQWSEQVVESTTCTVTSSAIAPGDPAPDAMRCQFPTQVGGSWRITAVVTDEQGHRNRSELTVWVSGAENRPARTVTQESVTIVPDARTYAVGTTARLLVRAPFAPAHGLATVTRAGITATIPIDAPDGSAVVPVPITDTAIGGVQVQVDLAGTAPRTADDGSPAAGAPPRPAYAIGSIHLDVPPVQRALTVTATPADRSLNPGGKTSVSVAVAGPDGAPVAGADVALVVVDEAVLSLTGYELADPLTVFYAAIGSQLQSRYARADVVLDQPELLLPEAGPGALGVTPMASAAGEAAPATTAAAGKSALSRTAGVAPAADDAAAPAGAPVAVRTNLAPLAVYAPGQTTGADGKVKVDVPLPDNLTRYRVMAVAADGNQRFGRGEATITARLPLSVRPSAPRFLNFGDRFELPVVVQNQTDKALDVDVALDAANLSLTGARGKRVSVPANDRVEVRFPAAAEQAGTARFRAIASATGPGAPAGGAADAAAVQLPVYTPATTEAFATYGVVDGGPVAQPVQTPQGVFPQFGGLEIDTSSTAVAALTDAVLYLADYRYDSVDGYASRLLAVASLRDVLGAFQAAGRPDPTTLNTRMNADIARLAALQNDDGGWNWWERGRESVPWSTIQATHALVVARQAGYTVPDATLSRALAWLAAIESHLPASYDPDTRNTLVAYALHVRHAAGTDDPARARQLWASAGNGEKLQLDALAWLWPVVNDNATEAAIERALTNRATETAGAATFATSYGEQAYLVAASDRRTDGVVLDALIEMRPKSDLIPKVVAGLLAHQVRGRWNSATDNGLILVALKHYFATFEGTTPDFVARAWLGDTYAAEHRFSGRTTEQATTLVPMSQVLAAGTSRVVVAKDGPGRLYYRLGLRYAPSDLTQAARDEGFVVDRVYEPVGDPGDVRRDPDGTWHLKPGATVRIRLTLVADATRTQVALTDPLPAGLEPLNPALATSATPPPTSPNGGGSDAAQPAVPGWCWCLQWFEHQNLRDDRGEAYASYLPGGTYTWTYTARATTPGTFVVPPAHATELNAPETFGHSASTTVVVG